MLPIILFPIPCVIRGSALSTIECTDSHRLYLYAQELIMSVKGRFHDRQHLQRNLPHFQFVYVENTLLQPATLQLHSSWTAGH